MPLSDILVVDRNRTVRRIVERTLRLEGYRVRGAESGAPLDVARIAHQLLLARVARTATGA